MHRGGPITWLGLQVLYHGDGTGYEQWLADRRSYDADPEGWERAQEDAVRPEDQGGPGRP